MKCRHFIIISVIFCVSIPFSFAQTDQFNLSDYQLPELKRRTLDFGFNLNGTNSVRRNEHLLLSEKVWNDNFSTQFQSHYRYFLNSPELQQELDAEVDFSYNFSKRNQDDQLSYRNERVNPSFALSSVNRKYFNERGFGEINANFYIYYRGSSFLTRQLPPYTVSETEQENTQTRLVFHLPLKIGKGRIEPVQDARQAVYIFDELARLARVSEEKSDEEILELARLISRIRNERFFDTRHKRIYELQQLDSFLLVNNHIIEYDATYFATLADYWAYGNAPERHSGSRISMVLVPGYAYSESFYLYEVNDEEALVYRERNKIRKPGFVIYGGVEYQREKPINLAWQNSLEANAHLGLLSQKQKTLLDETSTTHPHMHLVLHHTFGYFPNTRTHMTFGYSARYVHFFDGTEDENEYGFRVGPRFEAGYYFSPQLRISMSAAAYYSWQDSQSDFDFFYRPGRLGQIAPGVLSSGAAMKNHLQSSFFITVNYSLF